MKGRYKKWYKILDKNYLKYILVSALVILVSLYFYSSANRRQDMNGMKTDEIINNVAKLINLPAESPTVATVSNPDLLKSQPFFANAKIGDKLLLYTKARMAILYSPNLNKIVAVAPLNLPVK